MHAVTSLGFLASQGESALMLAKAELKPRAIAILPFSAVTLACEAGFGAIEEGLAADGAGCDAFWLLL